MEQEVELEDLINLLTSIYFSLIKNTYPKLVGPATETAKHRHYLTTNYLQRGCADVGRAILALGMREGVGILELAIGLVGLVVLAVLFRAADMTVERNVFAVVEVGLWVIRG